MSLREVGEEQVLILSVDLNPLTGFTVVDQVMVRLCLKVTRFVAQHEFLEIRIIKHIRVHSPACLRSFCGTRLETKRLSSADESDEVLRS